MTETQTNCPHCGGTGFVPPFMDECTNPVHNTVKPASPFLAPPAIEVGDIITESGGNLLVWTGTEWKPVPVVHADGTPVTDFEVVHTTDVVEATAAAAADEHDPWAEWRTPIAEAADDAEYAADEAAEYAAAAADVDDVDRDTVEAVIDAVAEKFTPKTSADTFAALEAACDAVPPTTTKPIYDPASGVFAGPGKPMSPSQRTLLDRLIAERDPANPLVAKAAGALTTPMSSRTASAWIDKVMAVPADPALKPVRPNTYGGPCQDCGGYVAAGAGRIDKVDGRWRTFHKAGECLDAAAKAALEAERVAEPGLYKAVSSDGTDVIYRVRKSRSSTRLYAEKVVPMPTVLGDDETPSVTFVYSPKAMAFLKASDKLTWAEAREFGAAYSACVACGRTLSDARSLVQGYGATCAGHYSWPTVSLKQAEAIIEGVLTWEDVVGTTL